jgi:hypothetical protein
MAAPQASKHHGAWLAHKNAIRIDANQNFKQRQIKKMGASATPAATTFAEAVLDFFEISLPGGE